MLLAVLLPLAAGLSTGDLVDPRLTDPGLPDTGLWTPDPIRPDPQAPPTLEEDRLTVCLKQARTDPATAIVTASRWIGEASGAELAFPRQCLGMAYTRLLRWDAAERAFLDARDAALPESHSMRAKLAAMAGNSALAGGSNAAALADLDLAVQDAAAAGDTVMGGEIQIDRARALVALERTAEAGTALADARRDAPQNSDAWLLSATLSRRNDDLATAQSQIQTAASLDPTNPDIGLEAGLIAALAGNEGAARKSWQSVLDMAPGTPEAETARSYLDQLDGAQG